MVKDSDSNKPWRKAAAGELWVLTLDDGQVRSAAASYGLARRTSEMIFEGDSMHMAVKDDRIVAGVKVWPIGDPTEPLDPLPFENYTLGDDGSMIVKRMGIYSASAPGTFTIFKPRDGYSKIRPYYG